MQFRTSWSHIILTVLLVLAGPAPGAAQIVDASPPASSPAAGPSAQAPAPGDSGGAGSSAAPPTRAAWLQLLRAEKAEALARYEPTALERAMILAETRAMPLLERDGLYAKIGSITTGSGFAYGAGFRDRSFGSGRGRGRGRGELDFWAAGSFKSYWAANGRVRHPLTPTSRAFAEGYARQYAYPREEFTGIGPDSLRANRVAYTLRGTLAGVGLSAEPVPRVLVGGGLEWQWPEVDRGFSPVWPSIETRFEPASAPGLDGASSYRRPHGYIAYDYRAPRNPRQGGLYRLDVSHVEDRSNGPYEFSRVDVDVRQYIGFFDGRRVVALRALGTTTRVDEGDQIPFYLLPTLGGNDTLRGFRALRFRGPHRLLLQGEYRWDVWSGVEAALFVDAGKVAMRRGDLNLRDLETNWGFGFRFNTDEGVILRVDTALGSRDGPHLHIVFGGVF